MVNPTWEERDLPVLRAIVDLCEENDRGADADMIAAATGFDDETVKRAVRALRAETPRLFLVEVNSLAGDLLISEPTGEARRRVGVWPTPEALADRLIVALETAADQEADPEQGGALRRTAKYLATAGRDVAVGVASAALTRATGMS